MDWLDAIGLRRGCGYVLREEARLPFVVLTVKRPGPTKCFKREAYGIEGNVQWKRGAIAQENAAWGETRF
jgi:hypothetical protein